MSEDRRLGYDLLRSAVGIHLLVEEAERFPKEGHDEEAGFRLRFRVLEEDLEIVGFPILFALGVLSFASAVPVPMSEAEFDKDDDWTIADMVEHLRYASGRLEFSTDYVRGRRMKTDVTIYPDGRALLETRGRGSDAEEWMEVLKGKRPASVPQDPAAWS